MEVITENKEMVVTDVNGEKHTVNATITTTKDGFDTEGNPKVSVNINVPVARLGIVSGQNG